MKVSSTSFQLQNDDREWFNCSSGYHVLEVSGCVCPSKTIHLMAWGHGYCSTQFSLIAISSEHYPEWIAENRDKYGKMMIIKSGGMEPYLPNATE